MSEHNYSDNPGPFLNSFSWHWWDGPYQCTTRLEVYAEKLFWWELQDSQFHDEEPHEYWQTMDGFWENGPAKGPLNKYKMEEKISFVGTNEKEFYEYMNTLRKG